MSDDDIEREAIQAEDVAPDIPAPIEAEEGPTVQEPLRGLDRLARVALLGRDRILERAREPVVYVWQDIAVVGTILLLAGGPSGGKTTLLFLLLVARMNTGAPVAVLGRLVTPAPQGQRVVLIEGEHGEASTCRKLERSCELAAVDDLALDRVIVVARKGVRINSPEWMEVVRLVEAGLVSDIAIDTVARVAPGDANDEGEQVAIFDTVAQTIEAAPPGKAPTVWACAHTRKGEASSLDDVSGSTQRVGQADSVLLVKGEKVGGRTVSSTVTFAKLREEPDDYPAPVTFAIVSGEAGRRSVRLDGPPPANNQPLEVRISAQLITGPKTQNALSKALGRNKADVDSAISNLFEAREITAVHVTINGQSRKAFALRDEHGTSPPRLSTGRAQDEHGTTTQERLRSVANEHGTSTGRASRASTVRDGGAL